MAVDVFKGVELTVAGRHQFDDALGRMARNPRRLLERGPAAKVRVDVFDQLAQGPLDPTRIQPSDDIPNAHKRHHCVTTFS
jgi:hypothetical protein